MKSSYTIREFCDNDYEGLMQVWEATGIGSKARGDDLSVIKQTLKPGGKLWIAEHAPTGNIVGTSWLTNDGRRLHLHHIGVLREFRNQGLGTALTQEAINYAKDQHMQIKLEVHETNRNAITIYERLGFKRLGDYDIYIIRSFDK